MARHQKTQRRGSGPTLRPGSSEAAEPTAVPARPAQRRRAGRRPNRGLQFISAVLTLALIGVVGAAGAVAWVNGQIAAPGPLKEPLAFTVRRGEGARAIAGRLRQAGVISSQNLFIAHYLSQRQLARIRDGEKPVQLKAGDYEFPAGASVKAVMAAIARGRGTLRFITFPEGSTSAAITRKLLADDRLAGDIPTPPAEGVLMPDTYDIRPGMQRSAVLNRMNRAQQTYLSEKWEQRAPGLPIQSAQEAVILASIVQREMGPNDDPKRIASVFHNRLRKGMRLQSDPTILYGLYLGKVQWGKPIYRSEIRKKTAHNTYQIAGLPPTPICNPGRVALEAVLNPAETEDLYFVADGKGGHIFSRTNAEHQRNVKKWREIERRIRAREREERARTEREASDATSESSSDRSTEPLTTGSATPPAQPTPINASGRARDVTPRQVATVAVTTGGTSPEDYDGPVPLPARKPR
ncbi:MAG: endolytic transglycosylase MltG [Pseudomonadota bacterium]